jgi:phenylacetate-CoA ligase
MAFRRILASRISDPLVWTVLKRLAVFRRLAEFRRWQWDDVETFRARQAAALGSLLSHAVSRVPFYAERAGDLSSTEIARDPFACLARFPALEREELVERFDSLACEMGRGGYVSSSGGSTGEPVRFLHDKDYLSSAIATTFLFFEWAGVPHGSRLVKLWGAPRDIGGSSIPLPRRIADWMANRTTLDAFDMGEKAIDEHARAIARIGPVCVEGYADALYQLALHMEETGIAPLRLSAVVSSAGTLLPHMRQKISGTFGAEVFDRYGTREVGNVAAECDRHNGMHVFGETSIVDVVDDSGRGLAPGEEGDVLITNLTNYTMPLIRYRIGDRAVWREGACDCKRPYPLLERIAGRSESRVVRADGGFVPAEFFIHILGVEHNDGSIRKFQVVQESTERIRIRVVLRGGTAAPGPGAFDEIADRIKQMMGENCRVDFEVVDAIAPTATGKHRYVIGLSASGARPGDQRG